MSQQWTHKKTASLLFVFRIIFDGSNDTYLSWVLGIHDILHILLLYEVKSTPKKRINIIVWDLYVGSFLLGEHRKKVATKPPKSAMIKRGR